jgi:hypothetical protein
MSTPPDDPLFVRAVQAANDEVECQRLEKQLSHIHGRNLLATMAKTAENLKQSHAAKVKARREAIRLVHSQD